MNVYVINGIAGDVPTHKIFQGIMPFLLVGVVLIVLLIAFPEIHSFYLG